MHVLITGGAGFIGSHIAERHLANGDHVHVVDDLTTGSLENIRPFRSSAGFYFDEADILVWQNLEKAVGWADRVYHMAAVVGMFRVLEDPVKVLSANVAACERLLRAVRASTWKPQILIASSSEVYGMTHGRDLPENSELVIRSGATPRWNYAISKLATEALGLSYFHRYNFSISVARIFNTIGPRQTASYGMVVPRFVNQAVRGEPITVFGDGTQTRAFCDVRDLVAFLDLIAGNPKSSGEIINVGGETAVTIGDLAEMIRVRAKSTSEVKHISYEEVYGKEYEDVPHRRPSLRKVTSLTGYKSRWTLEQTIDDLIEQARKQMESRYRRAG